MSSLAQIVPIMMCDILSTHGSCSGVMLILPMSCLSILKETDCPHDRAKPAFDLSFTTRRFHVRQVKPALEGSVSLSSRSEVDGLEEHTIVVVQICRGHAIGKLAALGLSRS